MAARRVAALALARLAAASAVRAVTANPARAHQAAALLGSLARVLACWTVLVSGAIAGSSLLKTLRTPYQISRNPANLPVWNGPMPATEEAKKKAFTSGSRGYPKLPLFPEFWYVHGHRDKQLKEEFAFYNPGSNGFFANGKGSNAKGDVRRRSLRGYAL